MANFRVERGLLKENPVSIVWFIQGTYISIGLTEGEAEALVGEINLRLEILRKERSDKQGA